MRTWVGAEEVAKPWYSSLSVWPSQQSVKVRCCHLKARVTSPFISLSLTYLPFLVTLR
jgi:hypothetical protein